MGKLADFLGEYLTEEDSRELEEAYYEGGIECVRKVAFGWGYDDEKHDYTGEFVELVEEFVNTSESSSSCSSYSEWLGH